MTRPDVYYGAVAENYDASRQVKLKWKAELAALEAFLTDGPVLDVPFGTGRFVPIYRAKGVRFTGVDISGDMLALARRKYPDINACLGSAFDLRFADGEFATAVCVRFLEWLALDRAAVVLDRLRRIAGTLIVTVNHGVEGEPEAFTYDYGKFLRAIQGLLIERRQVTAAIPGITSEMFKLRPAGWSDVVTQFAFDCHGDVEAHIQRIADKHCALFDLPPVAIRHDRATVRAEYWSGERIGEVVRQHGRLVDATPPRHAGGPLTVVQLGPLSLLIDGRSRANRWMKEAGPHPVLVVRPHG